MDFKKKKNQAPEAETAQEKIDVVNVDSGMQSADASVESAEAAKQEQTLAPSDTAAEETALEAEAGEEQKVGVKQKIFGFFASVKAGILSLFAKIKGLFKKEQKETALETAEETAVSETAEESFDDDDISIEEATGRTISPGRMVMKRFFRSKLSMAGLIILLILFVFSFFGPLFDFLPFIWPEQQQDNDKPNLVTNVSPQTVKDPVTGEDFEVYVVTYHNPTNYLNPSAEHWLGTDDKGFDVFTRLMYGGRISLTVGFVVVILETILGVLLGGIAGYFGGWVDNLIMRIVDIFNCVPPLPMMMIIGVSLEANDIDGPAKLYIMMAMLTLFGWAGTARLVRGQILSLREQEFMLSAEASGLPVSHKILKHLVPNVMPQLIVSMTLGLGSIILTEATLGYLGIGLPPVYATWGNMINAATNNTVLNLYPNLWIAPGICIVLAVLAFNFIGDGLRDAFDPKSRR